MVTANDASNGKTVYIRVGTRLNLVLSSTYWTVHDSPTPAVLRLTEATTPLPRPAGCSKIPGVGCVPEQTVFTALSAGTAVLTASRTSCGEAMGCRPDQQHFTLTVTVQR